MSIKDCPVDEQQKVMLAIVNCYRNGGPVNYPELSILSQSVVFAAVKHMRETDDKMRETQAPNCETKPKSLACAGTKSPKSEICGKHVSPLIPQGMEEEAEGKSADRNIDAVDEILNHPDNHGIWLEKTCYGLEWGDLLHDNLEWVLVYFRGHLYRNGDEAELHDVNKFKKHFFKFSRNTIAANEMLRALHYHLDGKSREMGVISQDATFRTMMQNDFPNLYQMTIPLTMAQCNSLIQAHGAERVKHAMIAANMSKRALYTADAFQLIAEKLKN